MGRDTSIFPGFWDGIVVDTKAPATEPAGAVRVRIFDIHGIAAEVPDTQLPWAWPNFMFAGPNCGLVGVPPINSIVNVIFKHGLKDYPLWIGGGHRTTPPEIPTDYTSAKAGLDPKGWMWITPGGYGIVMNEQTKTVEIKTPAPSLSSIKIDLTTKKVEVVSNSSGSQEYKLVLDETTQTASIITPSGQKVELNEVSGEVVVSGTTKAVMTAAMMEIGLGATEAAMLGTLFSQTWMNHGHPYTWAAGGGAGVTGGPVPGAVPPGAPLLTELSVVTKVK